MKRLATLAAIAVLAVVIGGCATGDERGWSPAQAALLPSCQLVPNGWDVYGLNLDLIGCEGHNYAGLGAGTSKFTHRMDGVHVGLWGLFAWDAAGIQASGFVNNAANEINGIQLAGLLNGVPSLSKRLKRLSDTGDPAPDGATLRGAQAASIYNYARNAYGLQLAGITNVAQNKLTGAQLAFVVNVVNGKGRGDNPESAATGLQVSGIANVANAKVQGVQVSGLVNTASKSMEGLQVGLLVNSSKNLSGVQIGLLNFNKGGLLPFCPIINIGFGADDE